MANAPPNNMVPPWLAVRLRSAGGLLAPRYEASLYGPINSLLNWYFPVVQEFMIKPQGKIRPEHTSDVVDDDVEMVRVSLDSYGGEVLSREEKGGEQSLKAPDFTVVKATASLHNDRVLMIIEVKRFEMSLESAQNQIGEYFDALSDKYKFTNGQPLFDRLEGLLIVGKDVLLVTLSSAGAEIEFSPIHDITSAAVHNFVREIAVANW